MAEINKPAFTLSRDIPCAVLSFLSVFSLTNMLKEELPAHSLSNSVFSLMLFAAVYFLLRKTVTVLNKRLAVTSVITGFILSTLLAWGSNIIKYDMSMLNSFKTCMSIIFATPVSASLVAMIFRYSPMLNAYMKPEKMPGIFNKIESLSNRKTFFICLALIFIAWLPGFIASYPGIYAYDCVFQMQFFLDDQTSLHHPLISTY